MECLTRIPSRDRAVFEAVYKPAGFPKSVEWLILESGEAAAAVFGSIAFGAETPVHSNEPSCILRRSIPQAP